MNWICLVYIDLKYFVLVIEAKFNIHNPFCSMNYIVTNFMTCSVSVAYTLHEDAAFTLYFINVIDHPTNYIAAFIGPIMDINNSHILKQELHTFDCKEVILFEMKYTVSKNTCLHIIHCILNT